MRTIGLLLIAAAFAAFSVPSFAADPIPIRLCTGSNVGAYYASGKVIAEMASKSIAVTLVETEGTVDNLDRTLTLPKASPDACDAMIGQPDGPVYQRRISPASVADLKIIGELHREYLHVLCNKASGVDDLGDLSGTTKYTLAIGEKGSGAWLIWQNIVAEDASYAKVPTSSLGGMEALSAVGTGKEATCMLVPAGIKNGLINQASDLLNTKVVLAAADDKDFNDAVDLEGEPLYSYKHDIVGSKMVYPKLLCGTFSCSTVETISWNAAVYINSQRLDKVQRQGLIEAVLRATPRIVGTYGG